MEKFVEKHVFVSVCRDLLSLFLYGPHRDSRSPDDHHHDRKKKKKKKKEEKKWDEVKGHWSFSLQTGGVINNDGSI